ncbi:MAG: hypothetical protein ABI843_06365 [Dokdonella sp.]
MSGFLRVFASLVIAATCASASAAIPTQFAVAADRASFHPTTPLHKGDRLQVLSPYLSSGDVIVLARCLDDCRQSEIVRAWGSRNGRARGPDLLEFVTIQQDGNYFFAPSQIAQSLRAINYVGCKRSLRLHVLCSDAHSLTVTEVKATAELFRARLSSGSWIWVRRIAAGASTDQEANTANRAIAVASAD